VLTAFRCRWAVDQGNRKAYAVERALMAENSWATNSIIWEGYSRSPTVGITQSSWFWSTAGDKGSGEALKLAQQRNELLSVQVEAARQQLSEWQEVGDFQALEDGTWRSMRVEVDHIMA
jgi:hypothetical protein